MPQRWTLDTEDKRRHFLEHISMMVLAGKTPTVEFVEPTVSPQQFNAMHLWFENCAHALNDAGLDMRKCLAEREVDVPWTKLSFKEAVWKPLLKAMTDKNSTKDQTKTEVPDVADVIIRHFASKFGVTLPPWPSRHGE